MLTQFFTIAVIALLGAMLPGPDFAIVTRNTILHSRRSGYFTSLGVGAAILVHMTYCVLGLAIVIANSPILFGLIKYAGAAYLVYLGVNSLLSAQPKKIFPIDSSKKRVLSDFSSFRQGFFCNLLNPKATLFFLSLFTMLIRPTTPRYWVAIYGLEIFFVATAWFCILTTILSHSFVKRGLERAEKYIAKILGIVLISFGALMLF